MTTETKNETKTNRYEPKTDRLEMLQSQVRLEPVIIGRYLGFQNDKLVKHVPGTDKKEERSIITYSILQQDGIHISTTKVTAYEGVYDPQFQPPLVKDKLYAWPLRQFGSEYNGKAQLPALSFKVKPLPLE